jgi:hypothetical protein
VRFNPRTVKLPLMPAETTVLFWLYWAATIALSVWMLSRAARSNHELLGLLPVAGAMWIYFYGLMAFDSVRHLGAFLPAWATELGQLMALICLIGLVLGWRRGVRKTPARGSYLFDQEWKYDYARLWCLGCCLVILGMFAHRSFGASGRSFQETSAYWYMSGHLVYPGTCICLIALARSPSLRTFSRYALLVGPLLAASLPSILGARRGPFFTLVMVCVFTPVLAGWVRPRRVDIFGALAIAGLGMLFMVLARQWVYKEGPVVEGWRQAARSLSLQDIVLSRSKTLEDNEYAYHCGAVATTYELWLYHYGTGDLSLLLHWIPRSWWPDKPGLGRGWLDHVETHIPKVMGWEMVVGGAIGGVASSFQQYAWGAPLFWYLLGYAFARVYTRAYWYQSAVHKALWIGILASTHWLIAQGLHEAFVPACIYLAAPLIVFRLVRRPMPSVMNPTLSFYTTPHSPSPGVPPRPSR